MISTPKVDNDNSQPHRCVHDENMVHMGNIRRIESEEPPRYYFDPRILADLIIDAIQDSYRCPLTYTGKRFCLKRNPTGQPASRDVLDEEMIEVIAARVIDGEFAANAQRLNTDPPDCYCYVVKPTTVSIVRDTILAMKVLLTS